MPARCTFSQYQPSSNHFRTSAFVTGVVFGFGIWLGGGIWKVVVGGGEEFESALFKQMCELRGVPKSRATPYHAQSNGAVKRQSWKPGDALRDMLLGGDDEWHLKLPHIMQSICAMPNIACGNPLTF